MKSRCFIPRILPKLFRNIMTNEVKHIKAKLAVGAFLHTKNIVKHIMSKLTVGAFLHIAKMDVTVQSADEWQGCPTFSQQFISNNVSTF